MDDKKIYLHVEQRDDGRLHVVDQDGRIVMGLRSICFRNCVDDVATFDLTAIDYGKDGAAWVPNRVTDGGRGAGQRN